MSETILCEAVVEQIKTCISVRDSRWVDIRPTGQPQSSIVSDIFVAVHAQGWEYLHLDNGICEEYWIHATVSAKISQNHKDFWGIGMNMSWDKSLSHAIRSIVNVVHLQPDVINFANAKLQTQVSSPFVEMLQAVGKVDGIQERGAEWWGTSTVSNSARVSNVIGFSQTVKFFGGKRIQSIGGYA